MNAKKENIKIKICGVKDLQIAKFCVNLGVDFIGLNFSPKSIRKIEFHSAEIITNEFLKNNYSSKIVFLFYKNTEEEMVHIIKNLHHDYVQVIEKDDLIRSTCIKEMEPRRLFVSIQVEDQVQESQLAPYEKNLIIFDAYKKNEGGGTGEVFSWNLIEQIQRNYLLAGGLNPSNIHEAIQSVHPYGIDVSSGVEKIPGIKNEELIQLLIKNVKRK